MIAIDLGAPKKQATYADYLQTPEGGKFQLIAGEILEITSPSLYHQEILLNIISEFRHFLNKNIIGKVFVAPLDVYFSDTEVYQPDILILLNESFSKMKENKIEGAPDLVVEVLSPYTAYYDLKHKKSIYEKYGVREYWIVDPIEKTLEIFELQNGKFISTGELSKNEIAKSKLISGMEIGLDIVF
jgi:Uma2 family endonuclease